MAKINRSIKNLGEIALRVSDLRAMGKFYEETVELVCYDERI